MRNSWNQTVLTMQAPGPALTNSTSQASLLNGQGKFTMPAGFLQYVGDKWRIKAHGKISTAGSAPGNWQFFVMFGTIAVFAAGASPTLAVSASNLTWDLEVDLLLQSVGSGTAATIEGSGKLLSAAL